MRDDIDTKGAESLPAGNTRGQVATRDGGLSARRDGGSPNQVASQSETALDGRPAPDAPGTRPVAHVEIYLDKHFVLHVRVNGMSLAPILPPVGADIDYVQLARDIEKRLLGLTQHHGIAGKLPSYTSELRRIGLMFGGLLFGYRDELQTEELFQVGQWHNELDRTFEKLYLAAEREDGFVSVSFATGSKTWSQFPWELAIWRRGGEESHIGVAERFAFVRRVHHPGFTPRSGEHAKSQLILRHLSSMLSRLSAEESPRLMHQHSRIEHHLAKLSRRYDYQLAEAQSMATAEWQAWRKDRIDILQFFGHGSKKRRIEWFVEQNGQDAGLQIGTSELLDVLQHGSTPQLFVLISCYSAGFIDELLQRAAGKQAVAGLGMIGEWKSLTTHNEQLVRAFYSRLFEHGRLDLAIQETRRAMYRLEMASSLSPGPRIPENWFKPVVVLRDTEAAGHFQAIANNRRSEEELSFTRGPGADREKAQIIEVLGSLRKLGAPASADDLSRQGGAFQQAAKDLELHEFEELETLRWELVEALQKALSRPEGSGSLEQALKAREEAWQEIIYIWRSMERSAAVIALELGVSSDTID